eukprot:8565581-Karenia_brevis.AAC.1
MTRTAVGWIPAPVSRTGEHDLSMADQLDDLEAHELEAVKAPPDNVASPLGPQQTADAEAATWAVQWAAERPYPDMDWPEDLGAIPPQLQLHELKKTLASFPAGTGLGWDALHPRALLRLSDGLLMALLRLLFVCECRGSWPKAVALVVIVLLAKPDGGRRPIGLLPLLPRIWMRVRRAVTRQWERQNDRQYLYAGASKGAQ